MLYAHCMPLMAVTLFLLLSSSERQDRMGWHSSCVCALCYARDAHFAASEVSRQTSLNKKTE